MTIIEARVGAGAATGIGSMPGTQVRAAMAVIAGELLELPHLPELPARGPGGEMVGRSFGLLNQVDTALAIETTPAGWRQARGENRVMRRAKSWLGEDLDALEAALQGAPAVKLQLAGPFTLAAAVEPVSGERLISDAGAVRDLAAALSVAIASHIAEVRKRVPGAAVVVQIDEPAAPAALQGALPTRSGRGRIAPLEVAFAEQVWSSLVVAAPAGVELWLHSCGSPAPVGLAVRSGFAGVAVPLDLIEVALYPQLSDLWQRAGLLVAGLSAYPNGSDLVGIMRRMARLTGEIGLNPADVPARLAVSPECGLAGSSDPVRELGRVRAAARALADGMEG